MRYISGEREEGCAFCNQIKQPDCLENLIIHRGKLVYVILNRFPYTNGHLMAVPYQHVSELDALDADTQAEMMALASHAIQVLRRLYRPHGFNIGINMGEAAGAGIAEHIHLHVVPRWTGDASFISLLGHTRVLPELMEDTYHRLVEAWGQTE
jgi:ATP adenylyltransferase